MDLNSFGYVIMVAALGMAIVFLFLWFLSGLMSLIRRVFADQAPSAPRDSGPSPNEKRVQPDTREDWVIAAAIAFLETEASEHRTDPTSWVASRPTTSDPWVNSLERQV